MKGKKFFSILLSILMICSTFGGISVSAISSTDDDYVWINGIGARVTDTVTYTYYINSNYDWKNFQGQLEYDKSGLQLESFSMPDIGKDGTDGIMINTDIEGYVYYTGSNISGYKTKYKDVRLCKATFKVLQHGTFTIKNSPEIVTGLNGEAIVDDFKISDDATTRETTKVTPNYVDLKVVSLPKKTIYIEGETFNSDGLNVEATDTNNNIVTINNYTLEGTDKLTLGNNTITVKCKELSATFDITVYKDSGKIYFEKPDWEGNIYFAHIYENSVGMPFYSWMMKAEKLEEDADGKLYYDLNKLYYSKTLSDGLKPDTQYSIMFCDNINNETCPIMFNTDCIGDTISVVGNEKIIENSIDSKTLYYPATWTNNSKKYGIPLQITSVGKIQGEFIPKGTSPYDIINKWDKNYPDYPNKDSYSDQSSARNHKNRLAEIKATFKKMIDEGKILVAGGGVYSDKETDTAKPTVKKVTKVSLSKKSVVLVKGRSTTVKATVTPTDATNKKLKWTTSNSKVAVVNSQGKITAKGRGNATIKVMALDGSNKYATVKVTVKQPVTSVKLNRKSANLKVKGNAKQKTVTLKATAYPKNANNKAVSWKSSNTRIATVNSKGKVIAKKRGTCYITATAKDGSKKSAKCKIVVK
mgnify:FL=1